MQLESGGMARLVIWMSLALLTSASPYWQSDDDDDNYVANNNIDDNDNKNEDDNEEMERELESRVNQRNLVSEAYRWLNNLEKREVTDDDVIESLKAQVEEHQKEMSELNHKEEEDAVKIKELQDLICELIKKLPNNEFDCPWATTTTAPPTTTTVVPPHIQAAAAAVTTTRKPPDPDAKCEDPFTVNHGKVVLSNGTKLNEDGAITCDSGYKLIGDGSIICTAIWNSAIKEYVYRWAPPNSNVCHNDGGSGSGSSTTTLSTTTTTTTTTTTMKPTTTKPTTTTTTTTKKNKKRGADEDCELPVVVGPCRAAIPRYHYDPEAGRCKEFKYGGCGGNENNFQTKQKCEYACL